MLILILVNPTLKLTIVLIWPCCSKFATKKTLSLRGLLQSMRSHKATGSDGLAAQILKIAAPTISLPLSRLINHCIDKGTFSSVWKSAKVTPTRANVAEMTRTIIAQYLFSLCSINVLRSISTKPFKHLCKTVWETMTFYTICSLVFADHIPLRQPSFV